jgi:hypothetical protein
MTKIDEEKLTERILCPHKECKHYSSDGSWCVEEGCFGLMGITVAEMIPKIAPAGYGVHPDRFLHE